MFPLIFFGVMSGSSDMRACRADSESLRKTAFLGFSSHILMVSVAFCSATTLALYFEPITPPLADKENGGLPGR